MYRNEDQDNVNIVSYLGLYQCDCAKQNLQPRSQVNHCLSSVVTWEAGPRNEVSRICYRVLRQTALQVKQKSDSVHNMN